MRAEIKGCPDCAACRSRSSLPLRRQSHQQLDASEIQQMISQFKLLEDQTKLKIRVALERFNFALRRGHLGDVAIDLCIALESLVGGNE